MSVLPPQVQPYDVRRSELRSRYDAVAQPANLAAAQDRVRIAFLLGDLDEAIYTEGQTALTNPLLAAAPAAWLAAYAGGFACQAARAMLLPLSQYSAVQHGLGQVQTAVKQQPEAELLFVQTSILFRLPAFLPERSKLTATAEVTLKRLDQLANLPRWFQREILLFFWELEPRYQPVVLPALSRILD